MNEPSQKPEPTVEELIKCPKCPMCGSAPLGIFPGLYQAFCPNDDCEVLAWVPWATARENLEDMHEAIVTENPEP